jgi:uroporphyrinogen-III synthase
MNGLKGKQVVITRAESQAKEMGELVIARNGKPYFFPVIEPQLTKRVHLVDQAIDNIEQYDWIIFTSVNAVRFFIERVLLLTETHVESGVIDSGTNPDPSSSPAHSSTNVGIEVINQKNIAAIGPKTASALYNYGVQVTAMPTTYEQEALVEACKDRLHSGMKVLYPRAQMARRHLRDQLEKLGICVDEVELYETVPVKAGKEELLHRMANKTIDVITFTSSSTVRYFVQLFEGTKWREHLDSIIIACIGPVTAKAARDLGLLVDVEAHEYTAENLLDEIDCYLLKKKKEVHE